MMFRLFILCLLVPVITSCASTDALPEQSSEIDLVKISQTYPTKELTQLSDSETISALVKYINDRTTGWQETDPGDIDGDFYFSFYRGNKFVGNLYVSEDRLGRDYGKSWLKDIKPYEIRELSQIVKIDFLNLLDIKSCSDLHVFLIENLIKQNKLESKNLTDAKFSKIRKDYPNWCETKLEGQTYRLHSAEHRPYTIIELVKPETIQYFGPYRSKL